MPKKIIVVGMGYVGIPVAVEFARTGSQVIGINRSRWKVDWINGGRCPLQGKEPELDELLRKVVENGKLTTTQSFSVCNHADAILICTETPFNLERMEPDYSSLTSACEDISKNLSPDTLVVVESTIAPMTMEKVVKPILEEGAGLRAGDDFYLAHCPERVTPGKLLYNLRNLDRVIGGLNKKSTNLAVELYKHIVNGNLYPTDCLTAEVVKTTENTYRDVNIAFANEAALICEKLGVDVFKVRELVNKCPYRNMHIPGAGVGGPCLTKDPWLLAYGAGEKFEPRLISTARELNDSMPNHVVELTQQILAEAGKKIKESRITVLGLAYLPGSDDTRNSPAIPIIEGLKRLCRSVIVHDPYVKKYRNAVLTNNLEEALKNSNCVVVATAHKEYKQLSLKKAKRLMATLAIVDGRNVLDQDKCKEAGFLYKGVGK